MRPLSKKIIIADKQTLLRAAVRAAINEIDPLASFTEAGSFSEAMVLTSTLGFDMIICDINLDSNIDVIHRLRQMAPSIVIFIYSVFDEELFALPSLQAGAHGYLSRTADKAEFGKAFKTLANGKKYLSQDAQQQILNRMPENIQTTGFLPTLTKKEFEVMQLLANHYSIKEIASTLNLKQNTVSIHKRNIYRKLDIRSNVDLLKNYERG
jgi:two-component system, NarL family, invasion response regulator UvrY